MQVSFRTSNITDTLGHLTATTIDHITAPTTDHITVTTTARIMDITGPMAGGTVAGTGNLCNRGTDAPTFGSCLPDRLAQINRQHDLTRSVPLLGVAAELFDYPLA